MKTYNDGLRDMAEAIKEGIGSASISYDQTLLMVELPAGKTTAVTVVPLPEGRQTVIFNQNGATYEELQADISGCYVNFVEPTKYPHNAGEYITVIKMVSLIDEKLKELSND